MKHSDSWNSNPAARDSAKRILVPVDCSDCSVEAIQRAVKLTNSGHDTITLLHVIDFVSLVPKVGPPSWPRITENAEAQAALFFDRMREKFGERIRFKTVVERGLAHEVIVDYAARHGINLIVLGLKPHHWHQWFRRQTARRVKNAAPCEILVVSQKRTPPKTPTNTSHFPTPGFPSSARMSTYAD